MTQNKIKVGDKVRYTGHSKCDLTHGKVYEVVLLGEWGFDVLDDVGDQNCIVSESYELVTDATHMTLPNGDVPDYNNGEWHGWSGGECPVHPKSIVDYVWHDPHIKKAGYGSGRQAVESGGVTIAWSHVVKFRVTKPYVEPKKPREWWIVGGSEAWGNEQDAIENNYLVRGDIIHVREVLDE